MKLNPYLVVSGTLYGVLGTALSFAPEEILIAATGAPPAAAAIFLAQALGAALLGFAWLNWFSRYATTRGVLGRPILMPNLMLVAVSFWLTLSAYRREPGPLLLMAAGVLGVLVIAFGSRLFAGKAE